MQNYNKPLKETTKTNACITKTIVKTTLFLKVFTVFLLVATSSYIIIMANYTVSKTTTSRLRTVYKSSYDQELQNIYTMSNVCAAVLQATVSNSVREQATNDTKLVNDISDLQYALTPCSTLKRGYVTQLELLHDEEKNMSVAIAIHMYKDVWQFERLLRAVYRPHHWYCVHVDLKSDITVYNAVKQIGSCFDNVIVTASRVAVRWGTIDQVDAELQCMRELHTQDKRWRYFINLTGQEFPLKTMWQLVRILNALNGSNSMGVTAKNINKERKAQAEPFTKKYNITAVKGAVHIVVVRGFVQYLLENPIAIEFKQHLQSAPNPDETFFATLNHNANLQVPGGYLGEPESGAVYPFIGRLKHWKPRPCNGYYLRSICIWSVADLPFMISPSRRELFINKMLYDKQHYALDCLEQWYWNETLTELREWKSTLDVSYYAELKQSHSHVSEK